MAQSEGSLGSEMSDDDSRGARLKRKPSWSRRFARQQFRGWRPVLDAGSAELFFLAAGVVCIALGIPMLIASLGVVEYKVPYAFAGPMAGLDGDARQALLWANADAGVQYSVQFTVDKRMEPPIYIAYELNSFFQNYRRYVRSLDSQKMHDGDPTTVASACAPYDTLPNGSALPYGGNINPCGQIAHSNFNDSFTLALAAPGGGGGAPTPLTLDESDISWPSDREHLYGPVLGVNYNDQPDTRGGGTVTSNLNEDQHWMVWMRNAGQTAVRKMYARLDTPLEAGSVVVVGVANRYNTYGFEGAKSVILTTNSWMGGRNLVLPIVYLVGGGLAFSVALFFFVGFHLGLIWRRPYGDLQNLSWLRAQGPHMAAQQAAMAGAVGGGATLPAGHRAAQQAQHVQQQQQQPTGAAAAAADGPAAANGVPPASSRGTEMVHRRVPKQDAAAAPVSEVEEEEG